MEMKIIKEEENENKLEKEKLNKIEEKENIDNVYLTYDKEWISIIKTVESYFQDNELEIYNHDYQTK